MLIVIILFGAAVDSKNAIFTSKLDLFFWPENNYCVRERECVCVCIQDRTRCPGPVSLNDFFTWCVISSYHLGGPRRPELLARLTEVNIQTVQIYTHTYFFYPKTHLFLTNCALFFHTHDFLGIIL